MMWLLWFFPAQAAAPAVVPLDDGGAVTSIVWARPFTLATPEPWRLTAAPDITLTEGWLVELRASPSLLRPSQTADPVLYAGTDPVMRFNWDAEGGCVVAVVRGHADLAATEWYFGSLELPGRVDAARAAAELEAARGVGVKPLPAVEVAAAVTAGGVVWAANDLRDVHAIAMQRVADCTSTPSDLQRSGIPAEPTR